MGGQLAIDMEDLEHEEYQNQKEMHEEKVRMLNQFMTV